MAAAIVLIPTLAVTGSLHLAGGRADSALGNRAQGEPATPVANGVLNTHANPPVDPQVLYWKRKAAKRLRLAQWFEQKRNDWRAQVTKLRAGVVHWRASTSVRSVICSVFGSHCSEALRVAWCESRMNVWAANGQYVNLFQMGYNERRRYGWHVAGSPAIVAARAAYRYFQAIGYSWSAWSCKP